MQRDAVFAVSIGIILKWMARMLRLSYNTNWKCRQWQLVSRFDARKGSWIKIYDDILAIRSIH